MGKVVPRLVDYHCHLDLYPDYEEKFRACIENGIRTLAVTTTPRAWPKNRQMASASPLVSAGLGIHPQLVGSHPIEIDIFETYLPETRYVGEIGLDAGPAYFRHYAAQRDVFERIVCLCAESGGKILSVHCVRAAKDVLDLVERHLAGTSNRVVLHWFNGSGSEARRAADLGCYFSINLAMLAGPNVAKLLDVIPKSRMLTETDGPFVKVHGRPAASVDISETVGALATRLAMQSSDCSVLILKNLSEIEAIV